MGENEILAQLRTRSETAIDALRQAYGDRLYGIAYNILGNHRDAEEVVSDTYLAVWNRIPPETPESLAGFVYKIGKHLALKKRRYLEAQKRGDGYDLCLEELADSLSGDTLETRIDARELGRALNRFLKTLNEENRNLFLRRYWFGDSIKDLAKAQGLSENTLSVRLSRLRDRLRKHLNEEGLL